MAVPPGGAQQAARRGRAELSVRALAKRYGGLEVFKDVSLELPAASVLGVIGPNGAGKTTLINVICGMVRPSSGQVMLDGADISGRPMHAISRLGVVRSFQQTNSFRSQSVRENLLRAARFSGAPAAAWDGVQDLLAEFDLLPRLHERCDKMPYGAQKMLGLMMAYLCHPRVLLLDEPAAGLERSERPGVDRLVQAAVERLGCSVLVVEHDMELVRRLCPRIVVLDSGRVLAQGPTAEVLARQDVIDAYVGAGVD